MKQRNLVLIFCLAICTLLSGVLLWHPAFDWYEKYLVSRYQTVPTGALWKQETIRDLMPPVGFQTMTAWINVATVRPLVPSDVEARVEMRAIRIIERNLQTRKERVIKEVLFEKDSHDFTGALFVRSPRWFLDKIHSDESVTSRADASLVIALGRASDTLYHGWTDPRVSASPQSIYFVEADARIIGAARLQLGLDYWRDTESPYSGYDEHCKTSNNCEAWVSDWFGPTEEKIETLRAPHF